MTSWKNIKKNLDEKVANSKIGRTIFSRTAKAIALGSLITTALVGGVKYHNWRSEPVYKHEISAVAPRNYNPNKASLANKLLQDFPTEIPGAAQVDKYVIPEAKYCLVHVRQKHVVKGDFKYIYHLTEKEIENMRKFFELSEKEIRDLIKDDSKENVFERTKRLKKTTEVQADIYRILENLILNKGLKEVYDEGLTPEFEDWNTQKFKTDKLWDKVYRTLGSNEKRVRGEISELEKKIKEGKQSVSVALEADFEYPNDKNCIDKYLSKLSQELEEQRKKLPEVIGEDNKHEQEKKNRYQYDAVDKAGFNYGIKIIPAETLKGNIRASLAMDEIKRGNKDPKLDEKIFDNREDILLQYIADQNEPLAISVYGGAHAWGGRESFGTSYPTTERTSLKDKDNIAEWNKKHPDKKFSLIEITPTHYEKK